MKGRVTADQAKFLDALTAVGQDAAVWRPDDLVEERILNELMPSTNPHRKDHTMTTTRKYVRLEDRPPPRL